MNNSEKTKPGLGLRSDFPIFWNRGSGHKIPANVHYLDSAASAQKPQCVIERLVEYLSFEHANIHRGAYALSANATDNYELARAKIAKFIEAENSQSIIFTRGTTESINLVAHSYGHNLKAGETILLTLLEHHSNIVPWQILAAKRKLNLHFVDINQQAELDLNDFSAKLKEHRPRIVAITQVANSFGSVLPLAELIAEAHKYGARVVVDAAQSAQHMKINVQELGADFLAFSGHKLYGPTGIGALYVKPDVVSQLEPFQGGGDMISSVTVEGSTWADFPQKFEAGTPAIAEAIALGTAVDYISHIGLENISAHEKGLFAKAWELLAQEKNVTLYGPATKHGPHAGKQASILSFNVKGVHAHDLSTVVDTLGVQIRAGHHCAMPALKRLGIPSSARASIGIYSDISDFEILVDGIRKASKMFA